MSNEQDIENTLGLGLHDGGRRRIIWLSLAIFLLAAMMVILFIWISSGKGNSIQRFTTQEATEGDLRVTITATGTLEPVTKVDVSSELSGIWLHGLRAINETRAGRQ